MLWSTLSYCGSVLVYVGLLENTVDKDDGLLSEYKRSKTSTYRQCNNTIYSDYGQVMVTKIRLKNPSSRVRSLKPRVWQYVQAYNSDISVGRQLTDVTTIGNSFKCRRQMIVQRNDDIREAAVSTNIANHERYYRRRRCAKMWNNIFKISPEETNNHRETVERASPPTNFPAWFPDTNSKDEIHQAYNVFEISSLTDFQRRVVCPIGAVYAVEKVCLEIHPPRRVRSQSVRGRSRRAVKTRRTRFIIW